MSSTAEASPRADVVGETAPYKGLWLVMDMDGTITPTPSKAGGHYLPLTQSPCLEPLRSWLHNGGTICAVSTAGRRMWRQLYEVLRDDVANGESSKGRGRLLLCGFSGAALFHSDATGTMIEDPSYRATAIPGGTCLPHEHLEELKALARTVVRSYIYRAATDAKLIEALSLKYHGPYEALVEAYRAMGKERFEAEHLTDDLMHLHGAFLKETNDALVDVQHIPGTDIEAAAQISVLGIPFAYFRDFFDDDVQGRLRSMGLYAKSQPNSVVVARQGVDKATLVRWLVASGSAYHEEGFAMSRAVAFGDCPESIDKPLTSFPEMAFVSLAPKPSNTPDAQHVVHVGSEEVGTAAFLRAWMPLVTASQSHGVPLINSVREAACRGAGAQLLAQL